MFPLPLDAVASGLDLDDPGKRVRRARNVLVFAELPLPVRERLENRGAVLTHAETVLGTVALLADRDFDAAILDMSLTMELVKRIKADVGELDGVPDALCKTARERHRITPFFLVMENEREYAVMIDPPEHSYLAKGTGIGLADAVMTIDVAKLLLKGAALA